MKARSLNIKKYKYPDGSKTLTNTSATVQGSTPGVSEYLPQPGASIPTPSKQGFIRVGVGNGQIIYLNPEQHKAYLNFQSDPQAQASYINTLIGYQAPAGSGGPAGSTGNLRATNAYNSSLSRFNAANTTVAKPNTEAAQNILTNNAVNNSLNNYGKTGYAATPAGAAQAQFTQSGEYDANWQQNQQQNQAADAQRQSVRVINGKVITINPNEPKETIAGGEPTTTYKTGVKSIHIKPENKGKFTAYKKRTGKTTEEALHSSNAHVRQMAQFAKNAKSWDHSKGGRKKYALGVQKVSVPPEGDNADILAGTATGAKMGSTIGSFLPPPYNMLATGAGAAAGVVAGTINADKKDAANRKAKRQNEFVDQNAAFDITQSAYNNDDTGAVYGNRMQTGRKKLEIPRKIEVEGDEVIMKETEAGKFVLIKDLEGGPSHAKGGIDMVVGTGKDVPVGSTIFPAKMRKQVMDAYDKNDWNAIRRIRKSLPDDKYKPKYQTGADQVDPNEELDLGYVEQDARYTPGSINSNEGLDEGYGSQPGVIDNTPIDNYSTPDSSYQFSPETVNKAVASSNAGAAANKALGGIGNTSGSGSAASKTNSKDYSGAATDLATSLPMLYNLASGMGKTQKVDRRFYNPKLQAAYYDETPEMTNIERARYTAAEAGRTQGNTANAMSNARQAAIDAAYAKSNVQSKKFGIEQGIRNQNVNTENQAQTTNLNLANTYDAQDLQAQAVKRNMTQEGLAGISDLAQSRYNTRTQNKQRQLFNKTAMAAINQNYPMFDWNQEQNQVDFNSGQSSTYKKGVRKLRYTVKVKSK